MDMAEDDPKLSHMAPPFRSECLLEGGFRECVCCLLFVVCCLLFASGASGANMSGQSAGRHNNKKQQRTINQQQFASHPGQRKEDVGCCWLLVLGCLMFLLSSKLRSWNCNICKTWSLWHEICKTTFENAQHAKYFLRVKLPAVHFLVLWSLTYRCAAFLKNRQTSSHGSPRLALC